MENVNSFSITPTDSEEIISIISSLNDNKSSGPNSIPTRVLKLLKKDISKQLADIFSLTFSSGVCHTPFKIVKVIATYKKPQNLNVLTTEQFHYYPILTKFWKN